MSSRSQTCSEIRGRLVGGSSSEQAGWTGPGFARQSSPVSGSLPRRRRGGKQVDGIIPRRARYARAERDARFTEAAGPAERLSQGNW